MRLLNVRSLSNQTMAKKRASNFYLIWIMTIPKCLPIIRFPYSIHVQFGKNSCNKTGFYLPNYHSRALTTTYGEPVLSVVKKCKKKHLLVCTAPSSQQMVIVILCNDPCTLPMLPCTRFYLLPVNAQTYQRLSQRGKWLGISSLVTMASK